MLLRFYALTVFLVTIVNLNAQYTIQYSPLKCEGEMPDFFKKTFQEKYDEACLKIKNHKIKRQQKKEIYKYFEKEEYFFDLMISNGEILYGDPISQYLNEIANTISKNNRDTLSEIKVYLLKHISPVALSDNKNNIYISLALISLLDNEAQLAFIISQEMAHIKLGHRYPQFLEEYNPFIFLNYDIKPNYDGLFYSTDDHFKADKLAIDYLKNTGYSGNEAKYALNYYYKNDPLQEHINWNHKYLEDDFFILPKFSITNQNQDKKITHEDTISLFEYFEMRKDKIEKRISDLEFENNKQYIQSDELFDYIQKQCRIELILCYVNKGYFINSYLTAYQFKHLYEDSSFSQKVMAYSLYQKVLINSSNEFSEDTIDINKGIVHFEFNNKILLGMNDVFKVQYLFHHLDSKKMSILSLRESWKNYLLNKNDSFSIKLLQENIKHLIKNKYLTVTMETPRGLDTFSTKNKLSIDTSNLYEAYLNFTNNTQKSKPIIKPDIKRHLLEYYKFNEKKTKKIEYIDSLPILAFFNRPEFVTFYKYELNKNHEDKKIIRIQDSIEASQLSLTFDNIENPVEISQLIKDSVCILSPFFYSMTADEEQLKFDIQEKEKMATELAQEAFNFSTNNLSNFSYVNIYNRENLNTEKYNNYIAIYSVRTELENNIINNIGFNSQFSETLLPKYRHFAYFNFYNLNFMKEWYSQYSLNIIHLNNMNVLLNRNIPYHLKFKYATATYYLRNWLK